jgi:hypothetical protein
LLKTSCCNATERGAIDANNPWSCPACINFNQNEKESRILYSQIKELVKDYGTQPGSQKSYKIRVKASSRASIIMKSKLHAKLISARTR